MIKRLFCKHKYHLLTEYRSLTVCGIRDNMYTIYCPKCGKTKNLESYEYKCVIAKQKVDEEYEREREKDRYSSK